MAIPTLRRFHMPPRPMAADDGKLTKAWMTVFERMMAATGVVEQLDDPIAVTDFRTLLTAGDAGALFAVSDYNHVVRWNGTIFEFGPGDPGNGFYASFAVPPALSGGWQRCDGSATTYLVVGAATLQTAAFVTPVVANQYFRR
jgi:hypothetical protein